MTRNKATLAALVMGAAAVIALGQNADKNSAGPTKNDYRLRVVEPAEGAVVAGSSIRVVVNTVIPGELGDPERRDVNSMPRPDVDVFLDGQNKGTMRDENNVLTIDGVPQGDHKIVLLAKNRANEIIDRKEISFSSTADTMATSGGLTRTDSTLEPVVQPAPAANSAYDSSLAGPTDTTVVAQAAPTVHPAVPVYNPPPAPRPVTVATNRRTLPETATSDPLLLAAGAVLLLGGLSLRRLA
jgi:hypothetical protein